MIRNKKIYWSCQTTPLVTTVHTRKACLKRTISCVTMSMIRVLLLISLRVLVAVHVSQNCAISSSLHPSMSVDPRRARARAAAAATASQPTPPPPPPPPPPPAEPPASSFAPSANGTPDAAPQPNGETRSEDDPFKLKFCTVCASNNNRYVSLYQLSTTSYI